MEILAAGNFRYAAVSEVPWSSVPKTPMNRHSKLGSKYKCFLRRFTLLWPHYPSAAVWGPLAGCSGVEVHLHWRLCRWSLSVVLSFFSAFPQPGFLSISCPGKPHHWMKSVSGILGKLSLLQFELTAKCDLTATLLRRCKTKYVWGWTWVAVTMVVTGFSRDIRLHEYEKTLNGLYMRIYIHCRRKDFLCHFCLIFMP